MARPPIDRSQFVPPPPVEGCAWIPLSDGTFVLVNNIDADLLMFAWTARPTGYAHRWTGEKYTQLHVEVARRMGIPSSHKQHVDHENRNARDCRRENLRAATPTQNHANSGLRARNTSGYKGVSRYKGGRWQAGIRFQGKGHHLGHFDDPVSAARAYDAAAVKLFGIFAHLNFPPQAS
jgi:hypothetical protein